MLGWGIAVALLAWAVARIAGGYPRPERPLRRLWRGEAATVAAAAEATFPPGGAVPPSGRDADVVGYLDRLLDATHPPLRVQMRMLFFLIEHATLFFPAPGGLAGVRRFSKLTLDQRVAVLDAWASSRLFPRRLVFTSLRALLTLGFFAHPPVLRDLRLAPYAFDSPVCEADLLYPPIGAPASAARAADELTPPSDGTPLDLDGPLHPAYAEGAS